MDTISRAMKYLKRLLDQIADQEQPEVPRELIKELDRSEAGVPVPSADLPVDIDPEILQVFVEEASELRGDLQNRLADWKKDPRNSVHSEEIARILHTLKGGARLASLSRVGDLAQEFEAVIKAVNDRQAEFSDELQVEIQPLFTKLQAEIGDITDFYQKIARR